MISEDIVHRTVSLEGGAGVAHGVTIRLITIEKETSFTSAANFSFTSFAAFRIPGAIHTGYTSRTDGIGNNRGCHIRAPLEEFFELG